LIEGKKLRGRSFEIWRGYSWGQEDAIHVSGPVIKE